MENGVENKPHWRADNEDLAVGSTDVVAAAAAAAASKVSSLHPSC